MASLVASIKGWSTKDGSATGKAARCTLSGASRSTEQTRFWYSSSAMKGARGAISLATVTRHSHRAA